MIDTLRRYARQRVTSHRSPTAAAAWSDAFRKLGVVAVVVAAIVARPETSSAQENPVHWQVAEPSATVQPGVWTTLRVTASVDSPWHLYSLTQPRPPIATVISVGPTRLLKSRKGRQPKPVKKYDPNFEIQSELFTGRVQFEIPIAVGASTKPGKHRAFVAVLYQACTDVVCLPPAQDTFDVVLTVGALPPGAAASLESEGPADEPPPGIGQLPERDPGEASDLPAATADRAAAGTGSTLVAVAGAGATALPSGSQGLWAFLALAALMGGLALLTPCVFPMIPITVSYFTRRHQGTPEAGDRSRSAREALIYGGGIVVAFSALGLFLAIVFGATGINQFAANPWVNLVVAALFIGFALDLLGVYEFRLPSQLLTKLNSGPERGGVLGLLLMGIVFSVTTFTCTVPFVGTLLVAAAAGDWLWPLIGMLVFSTVFALPFFLLALVPQVLNTLPRSGSWMGALKVTLGLIELGAAFKFLSNADLVWEVGILHRSVVIAIWVAIAALIALYLLGQLRLTSEQSTSIPPTIGVGRLLAGGCFVAFTAFLAAGLLGRPLGEVDAFLPPQTYPGDEAGRQTSGTGERTGELAWFASYEDGLEEARATNRPIFVDFTGFTCTNCRWMEANVFSRSDIQGLFGNYVLVRLYTDGQGEKYTRNRDLQLKRFGTVAMPLYVILSPTGESIATLAGLTRNSGKFADFLRQPIKATTAAAAIAPSSAGITARAKGLHECQGSTTKDPEIPGIWSFFLSTTARDTCNSSV